MKSDAVDRTLLACVFIILLILILLLSCLTSLVGFMFPFTGFGEGLASIAIHLVFISMGIALPASLVVGAISRKGLVWLYGVLYAITSVGIYLLQIADSGASHYRLSGKRVYEAMFNSVAVLYLILAI